ncbi:MAG: serine/threonine-protein phosphatase, partial [Verrucomicrobiaceae bacterium]
GDVGGDFFEVLSLSDTEAGIFVSDVMGHGVKAALLAALIRGLLEQLKPVAADPARFMHDVNEALVGILRDTGDTMFASAVYVVIDVRNNLLRYASAGHSRPLHLHRRTGDVAPLQFTEGITGPVLGLFPNAVYKTGEAEIEPGDGLLIYTDGVFEVSDSHDEEFGEKRLREAIQRRVSLPLERIFTEVVGEIQEFSERRTFEDDVCMVGLEVDFK